MNTDSSVNVVVFEVQIDHRLERLLGEGPTGAADSIRRCWNGLAALLGAHPSSVRRVYAQWEPTPEDRAFLAAEFPQRMRVSYSFRRPPDHRDWGNPTEEFARAINEFERQYHTVGAGSAGSRGRRRRPWWRYWDWPGEATYLFTGEPQ